MKTIALTTTVFTLAAASVWSQSQSQSEVEFLRARADAQERKIVELEKELNRLKAYHATQAAPKAEPGAATSSQPKAAADSREYVVQKGDALSLIASRHKTTVAAIIEANNLRNDRIQVGQKLRIPAASAAPQAAPEAAPEKPAVAADAGKVEVTPAKHVVKTGDTFYSIARHYGISVASLMAANPKVKPTSMRVGQTLMIDGNAKPAAKASAPAPVAKRPAAPAAPAAKAKAPEAKSKPAKSPTSRGGAEPAIRTITVNKQMTYGQFASKYGASTSQLNALNGLNLSKNTMLAKGSELYVPKY